MGSFTTLFAFPYPVGTDRVMDGDNAIQALAQKVEDQLAGAGVAPGGPYRSQAGNVFASNSLAATNGIVQVAATFAVGRFTATPVVMSSAFSTSSYLAASSSAPSTTSVNLRVINPSNALGVAVYASFYAVQMTPSAGAGLLSIPEPNGDPYLATCDTADCENAGQAVPITWDDPELAPVVACGVCGQPIADVVSA